MRTNNKQRINAAANIRKELTKLKSLGMGFLVPVKNGEKRTVLTSEGWLIDGAQFSSSGNGGEWQHPKTHTKINVIMVSEK